jgi:hypothetical protein
VKQLVVELIDHVTDQVGDLGAAGPLCMQPPDLIPVVGQEILAAREVERTLLFKSGHAGIADSVYVIGEIRIEKELHGASTACTGPVGRLNNLYATNEGFKATHFCRVVETGIQALLSGAMMCILWSGAR